MADWKSRWRSLVSRRREREPLLGLQEPPAPADDASPDAVDELASDDVAAAAVDASAGVTEATEAVAREDAERSPAAAAAESAGAVPEVAPVAETPGESAEPDAAAESAAAAEPTAAPADDVSDELEALRAEAARLAAELEAERSRSASLEQEVAALSDQDVLTGLANARRFNDRLGVAVTHALRQKHKLAIVQLGIDRFESVRDAMGSGAADDLLRNVALVLESTLRQGDTIAHLSPDPVFTVLLPGVKHDEDVTVIADKLRLALRSPFSVGGSDLLVTASIGMALFPDDGSDSESLLQSAGLAMERAREKGGDAWDVHAPGSRARAAQRQARETALQRALVRGGLELYWAPVLTCDTGVVVGMESLLRWRGGDRPPVASDFVSLADVSGLAVPLGQWLLRAACRQLGLWRRLGHEGLVIGVGISARQLAHAAFGKLVRRVLDETQVPPGALELAIPASELATLPEGAHERLADLRSLGARVALDAFGTADSRVVDPHRFALDTVRVEESVVREATASADRAAVIRATVALARARGLRVVAPGADSEAHRTLLVRLRCDHMLGRLCGAPMPADAAERVLRAARDRTKTASPGAAGRIL